MPSSIDEAVVILAEIVAEHDLNSLPLLSSLPFVSLPFPRGTPGEAVRGAMHPRPMEDLFSAFITERTFWAAKLPLGAA